MVEIIRETRERGKTLRPAIDLDRNTWKIFRERYKNKDVRDTLITELLKRQIEHERIKINISVE